MSQFLATTIALAVYAVFLLPLAWAIIANQRRAIAWSYVTVMLALAVFHTGFFQRPMLASTDVVVPSYAAVADEQCRQIVDLMNQASVMIDRSDPAGITITGPGWDQVPEEVREVVVECLRRESSAENAEGPQGIRQ